MRNSLQPEKMMRIAQNFPDLNFDWLLLGRGEMLYKDCKKSDINAIDEKFRTNPNNNDDVIGLMGVLSRFLLNQQQYQDVVKDMVAIYEKINNK